VTYDKPESWLWIDISRWYQPWQQLLYLSLPYTAHYSSTTSSLSLVPPQLEGCSLCTLPAAGRGLYPGEWEEWRERGVLSDQSLPVLGWSYPGRGLTLSASSV